jgi:hypothetical protein
VLSGAGEHPVFHVAHHHGGARLGLDLSDLGGQLHTAAQQL